jgi:PAS domain S-box-containing protein
MLVDIFEVRSAVESDAVVPCFQPIFELRTGRLNGFEVLARWQHPQLGLVLPENFIALAEENGLIGRLGYQILRKAFTSAPMLPEPLVLAVNVSPIQLQDPNLPSQIREAAEAAGFPLKRLVVEITESALVNNPEGAQKIAVELKALGCRLALDDFGTGYSSLRHLQALPFDELKIDRSFVQSMTSERESRKIVASVVGLGYSLGLSTVAEGVETEEQADMLLWFGCDIGQGWLYGQPLPADHIPDMVTAAPRRAATNLLVKGRDSFVSSLEALPSQRLAQLRAIYDGTPAGLCFLDRDLRYVSLNQHYADLSGAPLAAYVGKTVQEMIPDVFPRIEPFLLRALQGEAIKDEEVHRPSHNGEQPELTTLISYQPAFDEAGEQIGLSVSVVDITACKRSEEALRESEEHYRHFVELNPQVPWVLDPDGNLLDVSSRWVQLTGLSKERTRNLGWLEALHKEDVGPTMKTLREALHTGKPIDAEYRVKSADGKWKWMRARGFPRYGRSGEIVSWYGGTEDIDERKQLEDQLRRSRV